MLTASILGGFLAAALVMAWSFRRGGGLRGTISHVSYFALIWAISYPLRALLISTASVDTQVVGRWTDDDLARSVAVATLFLAAVWGGAAWVLRGRDLSPAPAGSELASAPGIPGRLIAVSGLTAVVSLVALSAIAFEDGTFQSFRQNALLELRVGGGPLFLLAEVATFGFVALVAAALRARWLRRPWLVGGVGVLHVIAAMTMVVALSTRRPLAALLFGAGLVVVMRFARSTPLAVVLLVGTLLAAPALDALRYSCITCILGLDSEEVVPAPSVNQPNLAEVERQLAVVFHELAGEPRLSREQERAVTNLRGTWDAAAGLLYPPADIERERRRFLATVIDEGVEGELSGGQSAAARTFLEVEAVTGGATGSRYVLSLFLTRLSSSFEGADHLGAYLRNSSTSELLTGIDHGEAWSYNVALSLIPRRIWSGKPVVYGSVAEQRHLYPYMFEETQTPTTIPVGFVVDFSYGFGLAVALLLAILLGRLLGAAWHDLWAPDADLGRLIVSVFVLMYTFNVIRGGTGFVQSLAILAVMLTLFIGVRPALRSIAGIAGDALGVGTSARPRKPEPAATGDVFFYPHAYLRDRQLDVIRRWPADRVVNRPAFDGRRGRQVDPEAAKARRVQSRWRHRLWLPNVKRRPREAPEGSTVYLWGGITATGPFITDLDNPYALVGYNLRALTIWRPLLRRALLSPRCVEIRCLSGACRESLRLLLGEAVADKATVVYPCVDASTATTADRSDGPRFLFVGTQFDLKGGPALLRAFPAVRAALPAATLDVVTFLPAEYAELADQDGVRVQDATLTRDQLVDRLMRPADVLVHPTYVESFGMVVLEAVGCGLAVVATDVYALREMVIDGVNGRLLEPPASVWDGAAPTRLHHRLGEAGTILARIDTSAFERALSEAMVDVASTPARLAELREGSRRLFAERFACESR